mgnify:CR=1 FL=1
MIIYTGKDYYDVSRKAANIMSAQIIMKPNAVLGLATGSTPVGMYKQLIEWYKKGDLDFSQITSVNLDEYKGLSGDNDQSYRYFMNKNLFDHVNIDKARTFVPDGTEPDSKVACENIMRSSTALAASTCSCLVSEETDTSDLTSRVQLSRV